MIPYIAFTVIWTLLVISQASMTRRINRRALRPLEQNLTHYGIPSRLCDAIILTLKLSIIPLGFVWAILLLLWSIRLN